MRIHRTCAALVVFAGLLGATAGAAAANFVLIPQAHGHVRSFASQTFAQAQIQLFDQALIGLEDRGVMEFDLSGVTGSLVSAELFLPLQRGSLSFGAVTIELVAYSGDGVVNFADDFAPGPVSTTFAASGAVPQTSTTVDVTAIMAGLYGSTAWAGFTGGFDLDTSPHNATLQFGFNVTNPGLAVWPELRITTTAIPLPASAPLLLGALALTTLAGRRRTRRAR